MPGQTKCRSRKHPSNMLTLSYRWRRCRCNVVLYLKNTFIPTSDVVFTRVKRKLNSFRKFHADRSRPDEQDVKLAYLGKKWCSLRFPLAERPR